MDVITYPCWPLLVKDPPGEGLIMFVDLPRILQQDGRNGKVCKMYRNNRDRQPQHTVTMDTIWLQVIPASDASSMLMHDALMNQIAVENKQTRKSPRVREMRFHI